MYKLPPQLPCFLDLYSLVMSHCVKGLKGSFGSSSYLRHWGGSALERSARFSPALWPLLLMFSPVFLVVVFCWLFHFVEIRPSKNLLFNARVASDFQRCVYY